MKNKINLSYLSFDIILDKYVTWRRRERERKKNEVDFDK
jgi:hypothetical protein